MNDTATVIDQYNAAFLERAPEKLVNLIADDCVMEGTGPAPDGNRWTGYDECLAGWQGLATDPSIRFEVEHVDVDGDRAVIRWRATGAQNYRGVNLMRVRDGKIVEALGYGKRPWGPAQSTPEETSDAHRQRQWSRHRRRVLR